MVSEGLGDDEEVLYERTVVGPKGRPVIRPVVHTIEECFEGLGDYYQPGRGWYRAGGKSETDPPEVTGVLAEDAG